MIIVLMPWVIGLVYGQSAEQVHSGKSILQLIEYCSKKENLMCVWGNIRCTSIVNLHGQFTLSVDDMASLFKWGQAVPTLHYGIYIICYDKDSCGVWGTNINVVITH